jgi:ATP-binding cassette subfamily F protein 3
MNEENVRITLTSILPGIDEDVLDYFQSMILDCDLADLTESLAPFIESYGLADDIEKAEIICDELCNKLKDLSTNITKDNKIQMTDAEYSSTPKLLDKAIQLSESTKKQISEHEQASIDTMWGFDKIREGRNQTIEMTEAGSAKYERKAQKDQRKWLEELESKFVGDDDNNEQISSMVLPDFSGKSREKDIQVNNFRITYGGNILLDEADLRLVYGRRYGLIGRNGIGKTTLLKHMATFDIEGFPRHHRVLHVKQEVKSSDMLVLEVVLAADVERTSLINKEMELLKLQQECDDPKELQQVMVDLAEISERMSIISVHTAESRAASILSGLQFTDEMQKSTTESLSGGWRMRVALAGALFIEPDLLMLDEPTNHLDLEAVLWLQSYLQSYKHTILLVSHDRAFLNDVTTDTILFKNLKLNYYRGNYDMFIATRTEALLVQTRQYEAQQVKLAHMQEFVDKFRYNAKRATLVQSRIKTIERETTIDAVEDEEKGFSFNFIDSGQLGIPVIQIQELSFGYSTEKILFSNVDFNIDQTSRIALVGPNGAGKVCIFNNY